MLNLFIAAVLSLMPAVPCIVPFAQIIRIPPGGSKAPPYKDLVCTEKDRALIAELITTMGELGWIGLATKRSHLKEIGAKINHVHPLKFLGVIFSQPHLKVHMAAILEDAFKRDGFMEGLGPNMNRESDKKTLELYLKDFAQEVRIPMELLQTFLYSRDWENFVRYLIRYES